MVKVHWKYRRGGLGLRQPGPAPETQQNPAQLMNQHGIFHIIDFKKKTWDDLRPYGHSMPSLPSGVNHVEPYPWTTPWRATFELSQRQQIYIDIQVIKFIESNTSA